MGYGDMGNGVMGMGTYLGSSDDKLVVLGVVCHGAAAKLTTYAVQFGLEKERERDVFEQLPSCQLKMCIYYLSFECEVNGIDGITGGDQENCSVLHLSEPQP